MVELMSNVADLPLLRRIEEAGLNASAPRQQRWLDGWLVRFSPEKAKRSRCVNALAVGHLPLIERLNTCQRLFDTERLPMIFRVTPFSEPADLDAELKEQGLIRFDDTRVMLARELPQLPTTASGMQVAGLCFHALTASDFAQRVGGFRGVPDVHRQAHADRLAGSPSPSQGLEATLDGTPVACGQFVMQDDLVGLYDVFTTEAVRGRGIASALCRELLRLAGHQGARNAYLQVDADNVAARRVYQQLSFVDAYSYHYRAIDPTAA